MVKIVHIRADFPTKSDPPRRSGLADGLTGSIVFAPERRDVNALRGLEDDSYLC